MTWNHILYKVKSIGKSQECFKTVKKNIGPTEYTMREYWFSLTHILPTREYSPHKDKIHGQRPFLKLNESDA